MRNDPIRDIINSLNSHDINEFQAFINRQRNKKNRKDLELFLIMVEEKIIEPEEISSTLYPKYNPNAYQGVRKRLLKHLMDFIVIKRMDDDTTAESHVMGLLSVARFLLEKGKSVSGWKFLRKAEIQAESNELYSLLNNVLYAQIQFANLSNSMRLDEIIKKKNRYKKLFEEEERAEIAAMKIQLQLNSHKIEGSKINISKLVNKTLEKYQLETALSNKPKILHQFMSMIRSATISTKNYSEFEGLVINQYKEIVKTKGFERKDQYFKVSLLYMICHVLYRNRKFKECNKYLKIFENAIFEYNQSYFSAFYPKLLLLRATVLSYQGKNDQSIELIDRAINTYSGKISTREMLNMKLNLVVYYFQKEDYKMSNKTLYSLKHSDYWLANNMGREWLIRKNLIELLIQFEMGHLEIAQKQIDGMKRSHKEILRQPMYSRVKTFIGFIEDCIAKPQWVSSAEYVDYVDKTLERWPVQSEDIQAMAFYCWLKSKMLKRKYYRVLVETVRLEVV